MKRLWVCELCNKQYSTEAEAQACENQGVDEQLVNVGDIVLGGPGFGWFDGNEAWVSNLETVQRQRQSQQGCPNGDTNCFDSCCTFMFYYVVTHIDCQHHRRRYHIRTLAMKESYIGGYTYNTNHRALQRVDNPSQAVIESSKSLLGEKCNGLL